MWEPGNPLNHVFLAGCCIAVISGVIVPRGSNMEMFVASLVPISLMATARFALGDSGMDYVIACAVPLFAVQMGFTRQPLVARMQKDARLRFQVEDLARELEETRDEA